MPSQKPNIVLILADDMGFSDIGCYGGEISTPNLDSLAENGIRFTQFFNTARCSPSRASLLTGLHPHQTGIGILVEDFSPEGYAGDLNDKCITIAELLKEKGYKTYMSGKWHVSTNNEDPSDSWPNQRGFDEFYGTIVGAGNYFYPFSLTRNNINIEEESLNSEYYYTDAITDNAVKYINNHIDNSSDESFFLYVSYTAPHWPLHAKKEDIEKYKGHFKEGWDILRERRLARQREMDIIDDKWDLSERDPRATPWEEIGHKEWQQRRMEVYAAQVDRMDQGIGNILETLNENEIIDNTLVIFLSDNGGCAEPLGAVMEKIALIDKSTRKFTSKGKRVNFGNKSSVMPGPEDTFQSYGAAWANLSNTPFRKFKKWTHEGGIATPFIIHWPEEIKHKGELRHQQAQLTDVMATIVDLLNIEYPETYKGREILPLEGVSLKPIFDNRDNNKGLLFFEHMGNAAVRDGKWKLVRDYPGEWELYDMEKDRTELHNVIDQYSEQSSKMKKAYRQWVKRCGVVPREKMLKLQKKKFREKYSKK